MAAQVLLDNTVLSNFALIGKIDVLWDVLGSRAATVVDVIHEYERGVALRRLQKLQWNWLAILSLTAEELVLKQAFLRRVNAGEAACLAVAYSRKMAVVTDDRDARTIAVQYGIAKTGTIGVLVEAIHKQVLSPTDANVVLQKMISLGYRSPLGSLDTLL
jgi:predicted nucleic acid-binding protein